MSIAAGGIICRQFGAVGPCTDGFFALWGEREQKSAVFWQCATRSVAAVRSHAERGNELLAAGVQVGYNSAWIGPNKMRAKPMDWKHRIVVGILCAAAFGPAANSRAQNVTISAPMVGVSDSFYENMG